MPTANLLLLLAVLLPPKALDVLGPVVDERTVLTPYGESGPLALRVTPHGDGVWVQPYTGLPTRTDPRATIYAAKQLGVRRILNWDSGIALNPVLQRGEPAIVADYISWVSHQEDTFFAAAPLEMDPGAGALRPAFCPQLTGHLRSLMPGVPEVVTVGADFLRRETRAEARMFRSWGADALSYNIVPEVALAQEMGLCYSALLTMVAVGADRTLPPASGEVRSTLHAVADLLPIFVALADGPITCKCA